VEAASDALDLATDVIASTMQDSTLSDADDTARVNVPSVHVHVHQDSIPDRESASGLPELPKKGPWRWLALLVGTAVAAGLTWLGDRLGK